MPVHRQTRNTGRFIDWFPYLSWLIVAVMFFSIITAGFMSRTLVSTNVLVDADTPLELKPIQLRKEPFGALRVDVMASLPSNEWATYEIQLRDQQGNVLASGIKQAWAESGTWAEDGETGTWQESDLMAGLDVRANQTELVTVALDVLEYSDTSGREIDRPVPLQITIKNGVVDDRYLWAGFIGSLILAILSQLFVKSTGKRTIYKYNNDSDITARGIVGGSNNLLRVVVKIASDEHSPPSLNVHLAINDENGEQIYSKVHLVRLSLVKSDGKITSAYGKLTNFFVLEPRKSYGFYVEVTPDASVDRTTLIVQEHTRTFLPIDVNYLKAS